MLSIPALRISFLVFQFISVGLLTLLLTTQYFCHIKRHPVVSALLVGDILRSLLGMLPGLLWRSFSQHVPGFVNINGLARTCGIDGLLYGYFLSVRLAFDVSLSFCIFVMVRRADSPEDVSLELPRRLGVTLAISPYIWALPIILIPAPMLVRTSGLQPPGVFDGFLCLLISQPLFVATRVLLWIPLGFSLLLSVAALFYIRRFYHRHQSIMLSGHNFSLVLRLGAMAGLISSTAVFFSLISASTNQNRARLARMSIFWQAISTFLEFFIFVESQVLSVWKNWVYRLVGRQVPTTTPPDELEFSMRQDGSANQTH